MDNNAYGLSDADTKNSKTSVTVNGAEVADCRKVKCRLTRFRLRQNKRTIITKEYFKF